MTAEDMSLTVEEIYNDEVRNMFQGHETIWAGELREIGISKHHIDLIPDSKPFKSLPYWAGSKNRKTEHFEVERPLKGGVIELGISEWAVPV